LFFEGGLVLVRTPLLSVSGLTDGRGHNYRKIEGVTSKKTLARDSSTD